MTSYTPRYVCNKGFHQPLPPCPSTHLRVRKVHLGMALLELLQHVQLPLLLARRLTHLLLPLVIHHLLDHAPRLAVQVAQLAVLGLDLGRVQEVRGVGGDRGPPLLLVGLVEVDGDVLARGGGLERPGGFRGVDLVGEGALGWGKDGRGQRGVSTCGDACMHGLKGVVDFGIGEARRSL